MTVEHAMECAKEAREQGHPQLAEIFESIAEKIALFNETSVIPLDEIYRSLGHEKFWELYEESQHDSR